MTPLKLSEWLFILLYLVCLPLPLPKCLFAPLKYFCPTMVCFLVAVLIVIYLRKIIIIL